MKKVIFFIILTVFLNGCTKKENKNPPPKLPENNAEQKTEQPPRKTETIIGTFETTINDRSPGREENIARCADALNGMLLNSGETFSFNSAVGPRTEENGYKKAKVMINGEYEMDFGGGVCQVSTTLYNAAVSAGLEITEHHVHEKPVSYVKPGADAAVNYNNLDLKFKNNTGAAIRLDITQDGKKITANIVKIE